MLEIILNFYRGLISFGTYFQSPLLLLFRLYWGWLFMQAGWHKLHNLEHFTSLLETYHVPLAYFQALFVATIEFIGGLSLMIGLASHFFALLLAIIMFVAYAIAHTDGFSSPNQFITEPPFDFLVTSLLVFAFGPGRFSLDYVAQNHK